MGGGDNGCDIGKVRWVGDCVWLCIFICSCPTEIKCYSVMCFKWITEFDTLKHLASMYTVHVNNMNVLYVYEAYVSPALSGSSALWHQTQ